MISIAIWTTVLVFAYGVLSRGLFRMGEPMRYAALNLAAELIHDKRMPDERKEALSYWLDELYSRRAAWAIVRLSIVAAATMAFRRPKPDSMPKIPQQLQSKFSAFQTRWLLGALSNSLAATAIFVFITLVAVAFSISYSILASAIADRHDHNGTSGGSIVPHARM